MDTGFDSGGVYGVNVRASAIGVDINLRRSCVISNVIIVYLVRRGRRTD